MTRHSAAIQNARTTALQESRMKRMVGVLMVFAALAMFTSPTLASSPTAKFYDFSDQLIDGEIKRTEDGVVSIETPLDGTTYDLTTGAVLEWCPKNNLLRNFLGGLKEKEKPVPLRVYPVVIGADGIYTKYSSPAA